MESHILMYVTNYLKLNYSTYCNNISTQELDALVIGISKSVRNKYNDIKLILSGKGDKFISNIINKYMNDKHQKFCNSYINLKNYISRYVIENNSLNCSRKTLNFFVEDICCTLFASYSYSKTMENGGFEHEIDTFFDRIVKDSFDRVRKYVSSYISNNVIPLTDIDQLVVSNEVVDIIRNTDNMNIVDLLLGKYDKKIGELAEKNRNFNQRKRLAQMPDTVAYIKKVIEVYSEDDIDLVNENVSKVDTKLRAEGLTPKEIVSRKYDLKIRKYYNDYRMKSMKLYIRNSIKSDDVPEKWEPPKKKLDIELILKQFFVSATLLSFVGYGSYAIAKGVHDDRTKDNLSRIDDYSYDQVSSIYDDDFEPTVVNILQTYNDYSSFGNSNFNYIGFYRAFNSASIDNNISMDDRFYIMDNMLSQIKEVVSKDPAYDGLKTAIGTNSCYLGFIYDRLEEMGYTEVRESEYMDLLQAYMKAKNEHTYADPVDFLNDSQVRLLRKLTKKYQELSEQYWLELGILLGSVNQTETATVENSNRRY